MRSAHSESQAPWSQVKLWVFRPIEKSRDIITIIEVQSPFLFLTFDFFSFFKKEKKRQLDFLVIQSEPCPQL